MNPPGKLPPQAVRPPVQVRPPQAIPVAPAGPAAEVAQKAQPKGNPPAGEKGPAQKQVEPKQVEPPLFDKWTKPLVAIFITGDQHGYLEPCGCTGLENQKGGIARRHALLEQLRTERGWNVLPIDIGNQVQKVSRQSEIKFQVSTMALRKMGYVAIGLGSDDLRMSSNATIQELANFDGERDFVSANAVIIDEQFTQRYRVIEQSGVKVGITQVVGEEFFGRIGKNGDITLSPSIKAAADAVAAMKKQGVHYLVLMYHGNPEEARKLVKAVPGISLLVVGGSPGEPAFELEKVQGTETRWFHIGQKGMHAAVIGIFADAKTPFRYQRVALTSDFADSKDMRELFKTYQKQVEDAGLDGLEVKPLAHSSGNTFVGSEACKDCHSKAYAVWEKTPHAHATESLIHPPERSDIARHFDPECLCCHTTGWEPQKQLPFSSGFTGLATTPLLKQSGCENCHGPGSAHVEAESNGTADMQKKLRESMRLPLAGGVAEAHCKQCHDLDNSPDFHNAGAFAEYWKKVEHKGKD